MSSELIIESTRQSSRIALLRKKQLIELHEENHADKFKVGDIYLGRVKKILPGLNAAFVDVGYHKDAFIHYRDLGPYFSSLSRYLKDVRAGKGVPLQQHVLDKPMEREGKIGQVLSERDVLLVQIKKVSISKKGPRLSCHFSLSGRYLVLVPFSNQVSVSKKIVDKRDRARLGPLVQSIRPNNFGVVLRTVAEKIDAAELDKNIRELSTLWEQGTQKLSAAVPGSKIISEVNRTNLILRDILSDSFDNIYVDSPELYEEIRHYIRSISPEQEKIVKLHSSKAKLFEFHGIERQLKILFGRRIKIAGGGSLVIDHTEAMHVIDVNSGKKSNEADQDSNALSVNLEAVPEIVRQIRLRDLGGIVLIDFIDMKKKESREELYNAMQGAMETDRSKFSILPLTKFGLMQITRHRVRPALNISTSEVCPSCEGTGKMSSTFSVGDDIERNIDYLMREGKARRLSITLHPYLHAYFTRGCFSKRLRWMLKYRRKVSLINDSSLGLAEYQFYDEKGGEIDLS